MLGEIERVLDAEFPNLSHYQSGGHTLYVSFGAQPAVTVWEYPAGSGLWTIQAPHVTVRRVPSATLLEALRDGFFSQVESWYPHCDTCGGALSPQRGVCLSDSAHAVALP